VVYRNLTRSEKAAKRQKAKGKSLEGVRQKGGAEQTLIHTSKLNCSVAPWIPNSKHTNNTVAVTFEIVNPYHFPIPYSLFYCSIVRKHTNSIYFDTFQIVNSQF
jgi:hypothetical protein